MPTLLGGVAMASVVFDCLFWLFGFLRMSTVAFTAQALGAGETRELRAILLRGFIVAALVGAALIALQIPLAAVLFGAMGGSEGVTRAAKTYFVIRIWSAPLALGQLRRARLADRPGARQAGAGDADRHQPHQHGGDGAAGAGVRLRHRRRGDRRRDCGSGRPRARRSDRAASLARATGHFARDAVRPRQADADAGGQPRHHDPHRGADRRLPVLHRAGRARRRRDAGRQCGASTIFC